MSTTHRLAVAGIATLLSIDVSHAARAPANQWPSYGQNRGSTNFSPLKQITPANVSRLAPAWSYHYGAGTAELGDAGLDYRFEVTPLSIRAVLYFSTPAAPRVPDLKASVTALEPETGKVLWKYESPRNIHGRGLAWWPGDRKTGARLFFATHGGYLEALDLKTGRPPTHFGTEGRVDAYAGVVSLDQAFMGSNLQFALLNGATSLRYGRSASERVRHHDVLSVLRAPHRSAGLRR